jgi:transposase
MSQPFDLRQFPDLPPEVVQAFSAQHKALEHAKFEASVERAARQHEQAVVAEKEAFITELQTLIEKLDPAQLELALEDLEPTFPKWPAV